MSLLSPSWYIGSWYTGRSVITNIPIPNLPISKSLFSDQLFRQLHCANSIFRSAIGFDLLGPILGDRSAADHDLDARSQAFLIDLFDHFALTDHRVGEQCAHANEVGVDLQCLADDLVGG